MTYRALFELLAAIDQVTSCDILGKPEWLEDSASRYKRAYANAKLAVSEHEETVRLSRDALTIHRGDL